MNTSNTKYKGNLRLFRYFFKAVIVLYVYGCSNAHVDDIKRGAGYEYRPGYPEVRVEVAGLIDENNQPKLLVAANILHNSLIFKETNGKLAADFDIEIDLNNHTTKNSEHFRYSDTVTKNSTFGIFSEDKYVFEREMKLPPGKYTIDVFVTDQSSKKTTHRSSEAYLPNPKEEISNITNIRILTNPTGNKASFSPVTTYDVGLGVDTLKFVFQVTNNNPDDPITIESRLIKFNSDTSVAQPMSHNNHSRSNITFKGIEYDNFEVIQSSSRALKQPGSVLIEFAYTNLERGNYRFEVARDLENKKDLYKARDFSLKSENYPTVKNPRELAKPLIYLMDDKEHEKLMSIKSSDSLKKEIDRFWLSNIKNSAIAKEVISLYYQRVEEANKLFSNYKEGWKTDTGKIYVLFGPPWYIDKRLNTIQWIYSYDRTDPNYNFYFRLSKIKSAHFPFENYILQRNNFYFTHEYQQIQLWKSGNILTHNL